MDIHQDIAECGSCHVTLSAYELEKGFCNGCNYEFNPSQRQWARQSPNIYFQKITLMDGTETTVLKMAEQLIDDQVIKVFGWFAVTTKGIDCLSHEYSIENSRLDQEDWMEYMSHKSWVNLEDFSAALEFAINRQKGSDK